MILVPFVHRALAEIDRSLRASDPGLAEMLDCFSEVMGDEPLPSWESMPVSRWGMVRNLAVALIIVGVLGVIAVAHASFTCVSSVFGTQRGP